MRHPTLLDPDGASAGIPDAICYQEWNAQGQPEGAIDLLRGGSDGDPSQGTSAMGIDTDKIDEAVLALLYLTLHDGYRAWKGHDWDALGRLHQKGMIGDPVGKVKSVVFTEEGLAESKRLFGKLFEKSAG